MRPLSIIVAEDDYLLRSWLVTVLQGPTDRVQQAANGVEVVSLLTAGESIDLVISDIMMPVMTGLEALAQVRAAGIAVPFLLITGFGGTDSRSEGERLGATILEKPISVRELVSNVRQLCAASSSRDGSGGEQIGRRVGFVRFQQKVAREALVRGQVGAARLALRILTPADFVGGVASSEDYLAVLRDRWAADDHVLQALSALIRLRAAGDE